MKRISLNLRKILRRVFILFGVITTPYVIHAAYGTMDVGERNTAIRGTVHSLETNNPIAGIRVNATGQDLRGNYFVNTDSEGNFAFFLPERESYDIHLTDIDGEFNGGFFKPMTKTVTLSDVNYNLNIRMEGENDVTIQGIVRSGKNSRTIEGIKLQVTVTDTNVKYEAQTDRNGSFSIRVPERENYSIILSDTNNELFKTKIQDFSLSDINDPLNIILNEVDYVTIRGLVFSATSGKAADRVKVVTSVFSALSRTKNVLRQNYTALTNEEGYFELRIPEREYYVIEFADPDRNFFKTLRARITMPLPDPVYRFTMEEK